MCMKEMEKSSLILSVLHKYMWVENTVLKFKDLKD
jgi:hypothetical protein